MFLLLGGDPLKMAFIKIDSQGGERLDVGNLWGQLIERNPLREGLDKIIHTKATTTNEDQYLFITEKHNRRTTTWLFRDLLAVKKTKFQELLFPEDEMKEETLRQTSRYAATKDNMSSCQSSRREESSGGWKLGGQLSK
ncbi:hypothetical protein TNCV_4891471 [Trichonephila clavipes]|nr:hypothetical protein TNCV_4891471 [Trichonephila clavipes]